MSNTEFYFEDQLESAIKSLDDSIDTNEQKDNVIENYVIDDNFDIDVNMNLLNSEGITEDDIDKIFNINDENVNNNVKGSSVNEKKQKQIEADLEMVKSFVSNPTHTTFNKLWERFYYGVKGYAYKFIHDWDLANDIACQTFTRAWEFHDKYDIEKAKFSTWLYIICRNLCLGELNKRKKNNYVQNDISDMFDSSLLNNSIALSVDSTQYTVEQGNLVANSAVDLVVRMYDTSLNEIENLGGNYTKILKMKLVNDMKIREIADKLNMNESTVKNYLYKGKETLEAVLKSKHKMLYDMYLEAAADEALKMM